MPPRIHIVGGSGSGTTTLGRSLGARLGLRVVDSDDAFWEPTDPPFQVARPQAERLCHLTANLDDAQGWVISGSLCGWGDGLRDRFTLVAFLTLPPEVRMARLQARESERFGVRIHPGGDMAETSAAFLAWAAAYDTASTEQRSRALHEEWASTLRCPVLRLDGDLTVEERADLVVAALSS